MKHIKTFEGLFSKRKEESIIKSDTEASYFKPGKITCDGCTFFARECSDRSFSIGGPNADTINKTWHVFKIDNQRGPNAIIAEINGKFIMTVYSEAQKRVKIPSIERGLKYMTDSEKAKEDARMKAREAFDEEILERYLLQK